MAGTFSENWHRVADIRAALRPTVSFRKQSYRGGTWFVLHDPYTDQYYRLSLAYYDFLTRLDFSKTIETFWLEALAADPEQGPGQQDIISLLISLNQANLLYFQNPADSSRLLERADEKRRRQTRERWFNILFFRVPLFNPDRWLTRLLPVWRAIFSRWGIAVWAVTVLIGLKVGIDHSAEFVLGARDVLAPRNLLLVYAGLALVKIFHELGHAAICTRYGGSVSRFGVMFLIFAPLPFVDASSAWLLRSKWQRIFVSSGGMLVELFVGALACLVWADAPPGTVRTLAYNMMFTATVSTVLFNANPLLRFDGYYILTDFIEIPNLYTKSREQILRLCEKVLFGIENVDLPAGSAKEGIWLTVYGIAGMVYRVFLVAAICLFISDHYLIFGLLLAIVMAARWTLMPVIGLTRYLLFSPRLARRRPRAILATTGTVLLLAAGTMTVPLPYALKAPGVVEAKQLSHVIAQTPGVVTSFSAEPGAMVRSGQELLTLANPILEREIRKAAAQMEQIEVMEALTLPQKGRNRVPVKKRMESLSRLLAQLRQRKRNLVVRARQDGVWIFPEAPTVWRQWVSKGQDLGRIVDPRRLRFAAVIDQEAALDLFDTPVEHGEVRLRGAGHHSLTVERLALLPHHRERLPSSALGALGGGGIAVATTDETGFTAVEPFYLLYADLPSPADGPRWHHGHIGRIRILMPHRTLAERTMRTVRQFVQKRYRL